ncbi:MAG TPA: sulfate adenylyltransferase subunit CysN [Bryobacteraceae bacterium]|nr:sulfate adenylyltransferase subunit CysN [Bryobacteraceae bacterium]
MASVEIGPFPGGSAELRRAEEWLAETAQTELLRFTTAGSVDDGKSTLIGRLLYDSKGVYEDQLASVRKATRNLSTNGLDLSLLTDGLRAEREQGITIDVAYRYFATPKRKFIIADTPGHEQYTRNMATGASTANLAVILIDARYGVLPQSRRHAYIATLLGIPHLMVTVNKMDLVDYREQVFTAIREEFQQFARQLKARDVRYIPISALNGDNVVERGGNMPWYTGPTLLEHLETVPISEDRNLTDMRFPVQYVIRPNLDFRGFAGQIASGVIRRGDAITVLPSGRTSRVKSIVTYDGELEEAFAPMSVTVCLEDEIDISRGDMLVHTANQPHAGRRFEATVVWMNQKPLEAHRPYLLKQTTQTVRARVREIRHRVDIHTLGHQRASQLQLNEIGVVSVEAHRPLFFDAYRANRSTGGFILIDPITNETLGAGMIIGPDTWRPSGPVTPAERLARIGHRPFLVRLVNGDGELARRIERHLFDQGYLVHVIEEPRHFAQAIRTAFAAGLVSVVYGAAAGNAPDAVPANQTVTLDRAQFEDEAALISALMAALGSGPGGNVPLTDGAGI